jgi:hypothetical protein
MNARREPDGDWHVQLHLDPEFNSMLNHANFVWATACISSFSLG